MDGWWSSSQYSVLSSQIATYGSQFESGDRGQVPGTSSSLIVTSMFLSLMVQRFSHAVGMWWRVGLRIIRKAALSAGCCCTCNSIGRMGFGGERVAYSQSVGR